MNTTKKKTTTRKRATTICLGCITEFNNTELYHVSIIDTLDMKFTSAFCKKCVKSKNFPENKEFEIKGLIKEPTVRKPRKKTTKKPATKKTTRKSTKK